MSVIFITTVASCPEVLIQSANKDVPCGLPVGVLVVTYSLSSLPKFFLNQVGLNEVPSRSHRSHQSVPS